VLITGFVFVLEELTRTLSRKIALILAFAAGVAILVKDMLEEQLEHLFHQDHPHLVPDHELEGLPLSEIRFALIMSLPIGVLAGCAGWVFTHVTWNLHCFFRKPTYFKWLLNDWTTLAVVGLLCGALGAIAYETTHMNGVWGTTASAVPEVIHSPLGWDLVVVLFVCKFLAFILATAAGGPGGIFVPSLISGGYLGLAVARVFGVQESLCSACAIIGMGSLFSAVMHLPVTSVILMFELTRAENLILHVVLASFISSFVCGRLPHGEHSFVHLCLNQDPTWTKLNHQEFIENDEQEKTANVVIGEEILNLLRTRLAVLQQAFDAWRVATSASTADAKSTCQEELIVVEDSLTPKSQRSITSSFASNTTTTKTGSVARQFSSRFMAVMLQRYADREQLSRRILIRLCDKKGKELLSEVFDTWSQALNRAVTTV
jgi:hypothetical protein